MRLLTLCLPLLLCACPPPDRGARVDDEDAPAAQGSTPAPAPPDVPQAAAPGVPHAPDAKALNAVPTRPPSQAAQGNVAAPAKK